MSTTAGKVIYDAWALLKAERDEEAFKILDEYVRAPVVGKRVFELSDGSLIDLSLIYFIPSVLDDSNHYNVYLNVGNRLDHLSLSTSNEHPDYQNRDILVAAWRAHLDGEE